MMRSLYAGVSASRAHQVRMDVIANNIANVNTIAFKSSRVDFRDVLYQTMKGAQAPVPGRRGGVDSMQVGVGVGIGSIYTFQTQGNLETTDIPTDAAIEGAGFFIVSDGVQTYYTRDGAFRLDSQSFLTNAATGYKVKGWEAENGAIDTTQPPEKDIRIPIAGDKMSAKATGKAYLRGNLDSGAAVGATGSTTIEVFDSLGNWHEMKVTFTKNSDNTWNWDVSCDPAEGTLSNNSGTITFDPDDGTLSSSPTLDNVIFNPAGGAAQNQPITIDISSLTQYASESSVAMTSQDGFPPGILEDFSVDDRGVVTGIYSNGQHEVLAQIALASFANPAGLNHVGNSMYSVSPNSGSAVVGVAGEGGRGKVVSGSLEMSNVDLAREFTDMIVTQRGFQANTRVITTSDEMLQELLTLKR